MTTLLKLNAQVPFGLVIWLIGKCGMERNARGEEEQDINRSITAI